VIALISPTTVLTVGVLAFVGVRLVGGVRVSLSGEGRRIVSRVVGGIRWRHLWPVPFVLTAVVAAAGLLVRVPGLDWGWWSALGGVGNPVTGSTEQTVGTAWEWIVPLAFVALLVPALPLFAYAEERIFRAGAQRWTRARRAVKVVQFGLVHALIGVPIGVALALSVGGGYFMGVYLRAYRSTGSVPEATYESTRAHTTYNAAIVTLVLAVALTTAFGQ
jgi:hypothetical protein